MKLPAAELRARAEQARAHYARCDLCGHRCLVDRTHGPAGVCREDDGLWLAGAGVHFGEEPRLVPSGLVLIGGGDLGPPRLWEPPIPPPGAGPHPPPPPPAPPLLSPPAAPGP